MKLTIGMIVKNEEKYLERCLTALKPILDNVDSELIITDTGSTDRTAEIAKKFTDKVLHFDWIGDFSAARNTGFEIAQGEWFMFVDADEIFQGCDNIIDFFNSGEYRKYHSAVVDTNNLYYKPDKSLCYDLFFPARLVERTPETRFVREIHEYLVPFDLPTKEIHDKIYHYGFLNETEEDREKKFKRNTELLLKKLENDENINPMLFLQLYDAYNNIDNDRALDYLNQGIALAKNTNNICLAVLYYRKAINHYRFRRFEEVLSEYDNYFKMNKIVRPDDLCTDAEMFAVNAGALYMLKRFDESANEYKKFFDMYSRIVAGKLFTYEMYMTPRTFCVDTMILPLFINFLRACIYTKKYNAADRYLFLFPIGKYCSGQDQVAMLIAAEIKILEQFNYKNAWKYFKNLDENGQKLFVVYLVNEVFEAQNKSDVIDALADIAKFEKCAENALNAAEIIVGAVDLRSQKKYKDCIAEMKRAITIYEPIAIIVSEYCKDVVAEYEREVKAGPQDEMQKLAATIKNNIRAYIDAGNIEAARKTLDEFRKIMPGDPEISVLEALM